MKKNTTEPLTFQIYLNDKKYQNKIMTDLPAPNTGLAKVAFQCYADTFVVNQSLVLCINICGENRHLFQSLKR
jgi:hypothetical protein